MKGKPPVRALTQYFWNGRGYCCPANLWSDWREGADLKLRDAIAGEEAFQESCATKSVKDARWENILQRCRATGLSVWCQGLFWKECNGELFAIFMGEPLFLVADQQRSKQATVRQIGHPCLCPSSPRF